MQGGIVAEHDECEGWLPRQDIWYMTMTGIFYKSVYANTHPSFPPVLHMKEARVLPIVLRTGEKDEYLHKPICREMKSARKASLTKTALHPEERASRIKSASKLGSARVMKREQRGGLTFPLSLSL